MMQEKTTGCFNKRRQQAAMKDSQKRRFTPFHDNVKDNDDFLPEIDCLKFRQKKLKEGKLNVNMYCHIFNDCCGVI